MVQPMEHLHCYLVGGAVRDELLGRSSPDRILAGMFFKLSVSFRIKGVLYGLFTLNGFLNR